MQRTKSTARAFKVCNGGLTHSPKRVGIGVGAAALLSEFLIRVNCRKALFGTCIEYCGDNKRVKRTRV